MVEGKRKQPDKEFVLGEDMIDLRAPQFVQVEKQGDRLYVHVDGVTVLRIYEATNVEITAEDAES